MSIKVLIYVSIVALHFQKVYVHGVMMHIDGRMHLQEFHIGQERSPAHAEERGEDDLIPRWDEGEIHRLHAGPINNAHLIGIQKFIANLQ